MFHQSAVESGTLQLGYFSASFSRPRVLARMDACGFAFPVARSQFSSRPGLDLGGPGFPVSALHLDLLTGHMIQQPVADDFRSPFGLVGRYSSP
jgi:hypothetical protein